MLDYLRQSEPVDYIYRMDRHLRVTSPVVCLGSDRVSQFLRLWNEYAERGNHVLILFQYDGVFILTINNLSFPMKDQPFLNKLSEEEVKDILKRFSNTEVMNEYNERVY